MEKRKRKKLPSYAEVKGSVPFDWNVFLNKNSYSISEFIEVVKKAGGWITCACGNQCYIIPRSHNGTPLDGELARLGHEFDIEIQTLKREFEIYGMYSTNFKYFLMSAKEVLHKIEQRSAKLIHEQLKLEKENRV